MENEKKRNEKEPIKNAKIVIKSEINLTIDDYKSVQKVRLNTTIGEITLKPKTEATNYIDGFKTTSQRFMKVNELPKILSQINDCVAKNGKCVVEGVDFEFWGTEKPQGAEIVPVDYRFIKYVNSLDKWKINLKESKREEETLK